MLFHPLRGWRHGQSLFLPPVPPCRHSIRISQDILRVHFARGTLHPVGMEDWSNPTWEFPGAFLTYEEGHADTPLYVPKEREWVTRKGNDKYV